LLHLFFDKSGFYIATALSFHFWFPHRNRFSFLNL
jgi:hypothetical protein